MRISNENPELDPVGFTWFEVLIGLLLGNVIGWVVYGAGYLFHWWA